MWWGKQSWRKSDLARKLSHNIFVHNILCETFTKYLLSTMSFDMLWKFTDLTFTKYLYSQYTGFGPKSHALKAPKLDFIFPLVPFSNSCECLQNIFESFPFLWNISDPVLQLRSFSQWPQQLSIWRAEDVGLRNGLNFELWSFFPVFLLLAAVAIWSGR